MRFPWANTLLLILIVLQAVTGYFGFTSGREPERWLLWLHGIGAYAIVILLFWKGAIILDVFGRGKRWTVRRLAFAFAAGLLVVVLLSGLVWTYYGPLHLFGFSYVTIHIFLALLLIALIGWHTIAYRWILRTPKATDRRAFLHTITLGAAGLFAWRLTIEARRRLQLPGGERRFTGSYEIGSFSGAFPSVSWINDDPAPVNLARWRLTIDGEVDRPMTFSYEELLALSDTTRDVIIDCTGGWYSEQTWQGIPFSRLLALVGPRPEARSVTFDSITGFNRRFSLEQRDHILLATHVAGRPLEHGHGFPLRLVIPGERGVNWVKWLTAIQLNIGGAWQQSPLPLT